MKKKITLKTVGIISCAVLLTATLTGGVIVLAKPMSTPETEQAIVGQTEVDKANLSSQSLANVAENYISEAEAKAIALAHAGISEANVSNMFCKLDYDDGVAEYEVEFWDGTTEYDYEINAVSGEIIGYDYDMESHNSKQATVSDTMTQTEYISEAEAKAIALAHAGVTESEASHIQCEFDFDDGHAEYEIEWKIGRMEYEYTVSATEGTVFEHDIEYDD